MALIQGANLDYGSQGSTYIGPYAGAPYPTAPTSKWENDAGKPQTLVHYPWPIMSSGVLQLPPSASISTNFTAGRITLLGLQFWDPAAPANDVTLGFGTIAAGTFDAAWTSWCQAAKAIGHPFIIRPFYDMNDYGRYPWQIGNQSWGGNLWTNTVDDFHLAWQRLFSIAQTQGATNLTFCFCPRVRLNGPTLTGTGEYTYAQINPGNAYWHLWGLDGYNYGFGSGHSTWLTFPQVFRGTGSSATDLADSYGQITALKPSAYGLLCEWASDSQAASAGVYDYTRKAAWFTDALVTQIPALSRLMGVSYFNWAADGFARTDGYDLAIENGADLTHTAATTAFRDGLALSTYLSTITAPADMQPIVAPVVIGAGATQPVLLKKLPPPNDTPDGAYVLSSATFTMAIDRTNATTSSTEPVPTAGAISKTVWYMFTTQTSGPLVLSWSEAGLKAALALYTRAVGHVPEFTEVVSAAAAFNGGPAVLSSNLGGGTRYYLQVGQI